MPEKKRGKQKKKFKKSQIRLCREQSRAKSPSPLSAPSLLINTRDRDKHRNSHRSHLVAFLCFFCIIFISAPKGGGQKSQNPACLCKFQSVEIEVEEGKKTNIEQTSAPAPAWKGNWRRWKGCKTNPAPPASHRVTNIPLPAVPGAPNAPKCPSWGRGKSC